MFGPVVKEMKLTPSDKLVILFLLAAILVS